ncbi:tubulin polyglutamylase TTLL5 isoform X2 [Myxocyprinus asiaticus]|uniref:tubulin polyglutamylase TTLL5 isoform X2 n=1 Tax=Myxocyprinus asiaticus TaxID=70543 RepID=UPI0022230E7C|nr:tubulin polyglutamylase TTLL5 isoform X2 [Myxocyprinus asiaticus]
MIAQTQQTSRISSCISPTTASTKRAATTSVSVLVPCQVHLEHATHVQLIRSGAALRQALCDDPEVEDYGNKWSMSAMLRYLRQEGKDTTLLMGQIEDLIIKSVVSAEIHIATACKMFVPHRCNCFELYGFDVLIDSNLKPWLLEVNLSPSLACDAPLDLKIKASMISDMFSLVGFVCQDPLLRQQRTDRQGFDSRIKNATLKPQRQRPPSASSTEPEKQGLKLDSSTLGLTAEEMKVLRRVQEEYERRGGFIRIFPTPDTLELYSGYLEYKTSMNAMLANKLFYGRSGQTSVSSRSRNRMSDNILVEVGVFYTPHVVQYERKLLTLQARKQRKPGRAPTGRRCTGPKLSSPHLSENEDRADGEAELQSSHLHMTHNPLEQQSRPKVNLLHILQQGWDLSKVQARMAFSSYLHRVQLRLLAESRQHRSPAWTQKDHDQMELVVRFLKRASSNLQKDMSMEVPSRQLAQQDRQRILSHQLGNFIQLYNEETKQMVESLEKILDEDCCINSNVFQEFILEASESELEEVLTFYTQKNKSASVFLGTKCHSSRTESNGDFREPKTCQNTETAVSNNLDSAGLEKLDTISKTQNTDISATLNADRRNGLPHCTDNCIATKQSNKNICNTLQNRCIRNERQKGDCTSVEVHPNILTAPETDAAEDVANKTHPSVIRSKKTLLKSFKLQPGMGQSMKSRSREPSPTYSTALDCEHIILQHCLVPSAPEPPPYIQPPPHPLAVSSSSTVTPSPLSVTWASARTDSTGAISTPEAPRPVQPTDVNTPSISRTPVHTFNQRLSHPCSAGQVSQKTSLSKSRPGSAGVLKEKDSLTAQTQSNQQAIISALRKLVEKQAARQYSTSSHISLLTQHLTNLNVANGLFSRGGLVLGPEPRPGPVRAIHADTSTGSSGEKAVCEPESVCDGDSASIQSIQQKKPSIAGSYQLQFAIQQLQQQRLRSRQLLNHSRTRHQAILSAHTIRPAASAWPHAPQSPRVSQPFRRTLSQSGSQGTSAGVLTLTPRPPSSTPRDGRTCKTAAHCQHKKTSCETPANHSTASVQHVVYDTVCAKTGLSMYSKLFHTQGSKNK